VRGRPLLLVLLAIDTRHALRSSSPNAPKRSGAREIVVEQPLCLLAVSTILIRASASRHRGTPASVAGRTEGDARRDARRPVLRSIES